MIYNTHYYLKSFIDIPSFRVSLRFLMVLVSVNVFETKFSIQRSLRQFLFEVNRTSIRGEIFKKTMC